MILPSHSWVCIWRNHNLKRYVHGSTGQDTAALFTTSTYEAQDTEATCMHTDGGVGQQYQLIYKHNRLLLSHKKWNSAVCSNTDGPIILNKVSQRKTNTR